MEWILLILSLIVAALTFFKPAFFWNAGRMLSLRKSIGDQRAARVYYSICTLFGGISLLSILNIIDFGGK
ncbi:MAG: hypothetical protein PWQ12_1491 [Clostridiales bacterium]|jgi:hypothetical protein|nr:hypothetical protein [Clostridiales bacterium]